MSVYYVNLEISSVLVLGFSNSLGIFTMTNSSERLFRVNIGMLLRTK